MREYIIKPGVKEFMKSNKITNRQIAKELGITENYVSAIINRKKTKISKLMAYAFCKVLDSEFEIEDLFAIM